MQKGCQFLFVHTNRVEGGLASRPITYIDTHRPAEPTLPPCSGPAPCRYCVKAATGFLPERYKHSVSPYPHLHQTHQQQHPRLSHAASHSLISLAASTHHHPPQLPSQYLTSSAPPSSTSSSPNWTATPTPPTWVSWTFSTPLDTTMATLVAAVLALQHPWIREIFFFFNHLLTKRVSVTGPKQTRPINQRWLPRILKFRRTNCPPPFNGGDWL